MTTDLDPDTLARTALAEVSMPDDRRAPEIEALTSALAAGADASRQAGYSSQEIREEAAIMAAVHGRMLTTAYARGV